jgi:hypothetical protein
MVVLYKLGSKNYNFNFVNAGRDMLRSFYLKFFIFSSDLLRIFIFLLVSSVLTVSHKHRIQVFLVYVATPRGLIVQYSVYKGYHV